MTAIIGWDIGGANAKSAWLTFQGREVQVVRTASHPYEIWREKDRLPAVLAEVFKELAPDLPVTMAVTMTAELADVFATKREGVLFVLDTLLATFAGCPGYVLSLSGGFVGLEEARKQPLDFAATNWLATALFLAGRFPNSILVDVGTTTTDIIPILDGRVANQGHTDLERLLSGELVYTGTLRTHLAAIVHSVPVRGRLCPVSSEYFAISGDVHLVLGHLAPHEYSCPTPDGQPPTVAFARQRLARLVCADTEMFGSLEIDEIAHYIHERQLRQIGEGLLQVLSRLPGGRDFPVVALGSGAFLAMQAAQRLGLSVLDLAVDWGREASAVAVCVAAGHLLARQLEVERQ